MGQAETTGYYVITECNDSFLCNISINIISNCKSHLSDITSRVRTVRYVCHKFLKADVLGLITVGTWKFLSEVAPNGIHYVRTEFRENLSVR
jgi:hypothetical protein